MTEDDQTSTYPYELANLAGDLIDAPAQPDPAEVEARRAVEAQALADIAGDELRTAAGWRVANSLQQLLAEANAVNPNRDKRSDGSIGDAAHATRSSMHNPNAAGVVCARDFDVDGLDLPAAFERARAAARAGLLPQLTEGGYLILNRRITTPDFAGWVAYTGSNPHVTHGHVSSSKRAALYDLQTAWGVFTGTTPRPTPAPAPPPATNGMLQRGSTGDRVRRLQTVLRTRFPAYRHRFGGVMLAVDGDFGPATEKWVREFQRRAGLVVDGIAGPRTLAALGLS